MRRDTGGTVMLIFGLILVRLIWDGGYQWYVKTSLMVPILLAAGLIVAVGAYQALNGRTDPDAPGEGATDGSGSGNDPAAQSGAGDAAARDHGATVGSGPETTGARAGGTAPPAAAHTHPHGHGDRVGVLLLVPVLALLLVAPAPLGSFAAERGGENRVAEPGLSTAFPELPDPEDGAIDLPVSDYLSRILHEEDTPVRGEPVRLTGFVSSVDEESFRLTRFVVGCCAADAIPLQVAVTGVGTVPDRDTWLEAVVVWDGDVLSDESAALDRVPVVRLQGSEAIERPDQPYEY